MNPILRTPLSYIEMKDPSSTFHNPNVKDMTFEEYLANNTLFEEDSLTKRLLCKKNIDSMKPTHYNLEMAKDILKSCEIGLFNDYYDSYIQFKNTFHHWKFLSSPAADKCIQTKFKTESKRIDKLLTKHGIEFQGFFDELKETNKVDMELYAFTVSAVENLTNVT